MFAARALLRNTLVLFVLWVWLVSTAAPARAQQRGSFESAGRLIVEVRDPLEGALPGATVTIAGVKPPSEPTIVVTDGAGSVELGDLPAGRYRIVVELAGFDRAVADDVAVRRGRTTRHTATLAIAGVAEQVTVQVDAAARRLDDNFSETLTAEELDQLPDDPEEAMALIQEIAGPDAEIRVNGFEEGELPPPSQIQAIRIRHDPFAASAHGAGRPRVDIITRPGTNRWEHQLSAGIRDQSIDARNPFSPERGEGQTRRLRWSSSGPIVKGRTSIAFSLTNRHAFDVQPIVATRPEGTLNDSVNQRNVSLNAEVRVDHALTATQTLRAEYRRRGGERANLGVGEFSLPERAYGATSESHLFRASNIGTFGNRALNELRFEAAWRRDERQSRSDAVTIDVANAFTAGGAQIAGGTREFEIEIGDDLELVLSDRHKVRLGFEGEFGRVRSDRLENANGRFVFPSLEAFAAGEPIQFVQRVGDPSLAYSRYELGWYAYDELRPRKNLQLGLGLRHEFQSFTGVWANFGPRASVAWTPAAWRNTTLRAGAGIFHDWYDASLHEQTLRLDGQRQRDLIVMDPGWPDPFEGAGGIRMPAPSVVRANEDLRLPTTRRVSFGIERRLVEGLTLRVNVFDESTRNRLRSLDGNAPVDGVRPQPGLARVTEIRSIGRAEERGVEANLGLRSPGRRVFGSLRYRYEREFDDADGALSLPADSTDLAADWGPASNDVRHRLFGYFRLQLPYGFGAGLSARVSSGAPYTIRTGFDDNRDAVPNDRPAGVGRNSERGAWHALADLRVGWRVAGGDGNGRPREGRGRGRGRGGDRGVEVYANVMNLFNRTNFVRYSGVLTSPYFGSPTAALPGRRLELGFRLGF